MNWTEQCRRWAARQKEHLITRSDNHCERCKKELISGVIHHITYEKKLESVLYVCKQCHVRIHDLQEEKSFLKKMIKWLRMFPNETTIGEAAKVAFERFEELGLDKDIPPDLEEPPKARDVSFEFTEV